MGARKTIARNAVVLLVTQVTTWVLTLLFTVLVPRYLGADAVGKLHFANSMWAIAAILMTFGMDTLLIKEIARRRDRLPALLGNSFVLRILFACVGYAALWAWLALFDYPEDTRIVVYIVGLTTVVWQLIAACQAAFQGLERMEFQSLGNIVEKVVSTTASIGLLLLGYGVYAVALVGTLAALVNLSIQTLFLARLTPLRPSLAARTLRDLLVGGAPYLAAGVFLTIYMQFDIVVLSLLTTDRVVGWYGAADQLFGTLLFVPTVFITAVFPALSRMYAEASDSLVKVIRRSFDLLALMSLPLGLGMVAVGHEGVVLLFGEGFYGSGAILALMGIVLILTYMNMLIGRFLISMDRQGQWTRVMAAAVAATLPLDLLLIPYCDYAFGNGGIGGALSFIITEGWMAWVGLRLLPPGTLGRENAVLVLKALAAASVMAGVAWLLRGFLILAPVLAGMAVYALLIWLFRAMPREEIALLREMAGRLVRPGGAS